MKAWIGVVAAVAGVVTLGFFLWDRFFPPKTTLEEWAAKANNVCDSHVGAVHEAFNRRNDSIQAFLAARSMIGQANGPTEESFTVLVNQASRDVDQFAGAQRKFKAEMASIERPDERRDRVDHVLGLMEDVSGKDVEISAYFQTIAAGSVPEKTLPDLENERDELVSRTDSELKLLGATRCLV
ncbi:hypothetical protein [Streptomyces sp. NPDC001809]